MGNKGVFTKMLAIVGAVLVWFPILAPVLLLMAGLLGEGVFRFDYLMPAELFPFALLGGLMMLWASLRAKVHLKLIAWGLGAAVVLLGGSQGLAVVTGLANGTTTPGGWALPLVLAALIGFIIALVAVGVGGVLLLRDVYKPTPQAVS
jgi:hypothetical protein